VLAALAIGLLPLAAWEIFSLVYYGFPLPNTAYAKLSTGIPSGELWAQGWRYFTHTLRFDPLTLVVILAALALPFAVRRRVLHRPPSRGQPAGFIGDDARRAFAVVVGIALYLLYILKIGGDFMGGRFFTPPLFAAVMLGFVLGDGLMAGPPLAGRLRRTHAAAIVILLLGLIPVLGARGVGAGGDGEDSSADSSPIQASGIADERTFYAIEGRALFKPKTPPRKPRIFGRQAGEELRARGDVLVLEGAVGMLGFYAGPQARIVDFFGLADPLLARLPALRFDPSAAMHRPYPSNWRIGHFLRAIPEGYLDFVNTGENTLRDPRLRALCERLRLITRGPLLAGERLAAIWRLNTRGYADELDPSGYAAPARFSLADLAPPAQGDPLSRGPRALRFSFNGIQVALPGPSHATALDVSLDGKDNYLIVYYRRGEIVSAQPLAPRVLDAPTLIQATIEIPPAAARTGFDTLGFFPLRGDGFCTLGSVRLMEEAEERVPPPGPPGV